MINTAEKPKLYRIWCSDSNDRQEVGRVLAFESQDLEKFLKETFIKKEYWDRVESLNTDEIGIEIIECEEEECRQAMIDDNVEEAKSEDFNPCEESGQPIIIYFTLEEIEDPEPSDYQFKTVFGTNDYWDLTKKENQKAQDPDPELRDLWIQNPQAGVMGLIKRTMEQKPELTEAFSPELQKKAKELGLKAPKKRIFE